MGRVLGLDLGTKRIGVAVSDPDRRVATPIEVVARSGDRQRDHRAIAGLVQEWEAERVVVGLPLSLDGSTGPAAQAALAEVDELAAVVGVPVDTADERMTSVTANRALDALDVRGPARRKIVDKVAAAVILQSWLDAR
ncbi:MAG TPA: Holliday junction resolvase RuvX [Acidimicrobiales bacterium]|nr:Holliday junction resolvase RuvX [Acidimicrobiales bacterium]